jgi:lipoate-protein ligase A
MDLHLLPTLTGGAAENMALDFLLLQRYPDEAAARFRHYGWRGPAFTFGYSQKIAFIRTQLPDGPIDLCRRATGGGLVDHRDDWTYTLVIPRGHPLEAERASLSYRVVHDCMAQALVVQGVPAELQVRPPEPVAEADPVLALGVCFQRAEVHDIVNALTGEKIAGAAQKRNKRGLLLQGSLWRPSVGPAVDWEKFQEDFSSKLAAALAAVPTPTPWPELDEDEIGALTERYASAEWVEQR